MPTVSDLFNLFIKYIFSFFLLLVEPPLVFTFQMSNKASLFATDQYTSIDILLRAVIHIRRDLYMVIMGQYELCTVHIMHVWLFVIFVDGIWFLFSNDGNIKDNYTNCVKYSLLLYGVHICKRVNNYVNVSFGLIEWERKNRLFISKVCFSKYTVKM